MLETPEVPEDVQRVFGTALDIAPVWHIRMQAAFQRFTDNAVSKTVNFPEDATPEDVREVYELAYKEGAKGCTIYRYGSRDAQVLNVSGKDKKTTEANAPSVARGPRPRPNSIFPLPVVIDWENDLEVNPSKRQMSTNVRTPGTIVLIESDF
jgi:ribonucleotide reductase alpha subunit